jgi:hypothetical protein
MFTKIFIILLLCSLLFLFKKKGYGLLYRYNIKTHITIITLIFVLAVFSSRSSIELFSVSDNLKLSEQDDTHISVTNNSIGGSSEHLELAYKLCQNNPDKYCQKYIYHYDSLRKSFHKLKDDYCKKYPSRCMELGL